LLAVQYRCHLSIKDGRKRSAVGTVTLMIISDEIEELELPAILGSYSPVQERADRKSLHDAVEQAANLLRLPHEFALNGW